MIRPIAQPGTTLRDSASHLLRQWDGPLTREISLAPGGFGLGKVPEVAKPDATTTLTCGYCSTGCGLNVHMRDGQAVSLTPTTQYPVNLGMACPKGWEALSVLASDDRATTPMLRSADGKLAPVSWDAAMRTMCDKFKSIQARCGNDSVAFISTGQIVTEEMALLGALAKFGMGMIHGDGNTRQCMATAAVAHKESFGFDAPPFTYADFELSDVIVLVGSNLCIGHPILWERVLRNRYQPRIIVIDPRRTETAMAATDHLAITPKSDLVLLYGLAHILIRENWIDRSYISAHTQEFDGFSEHVRDYTPTVVAKATGIEEKSLLRTARAIHNGERVSFWWTMGVNQSHEGVRVAQAIINLALMTGNIGKQGAGANSITGQCNAMGSRIFSNTTNLFGGRDFTNAEHRQQVARELKIDVSHIPDRGSWAYNEIIEGIGDGDIKGLWVIATNPAHSWIGLNEFDAIINKLDFLVVQDMYTTTETVAKADLLLPAAAWGEKEGTFINSERRFGLTKKVARAPGSALADFAIFKLVAEYWGCGDLLREWSSPEAAFQIMKRLSRGTPCDITGIADYTMLDHCGGVQWPFTEADARRGEPITERRLFEDGRFYHADGKARFIFERPAPLPEPTDGLYPFTLLTGRGSAAQWHTQSRTSKSAVLRKLYAAQPYVEIHPDDAESVGVRSHDCVEITSRRGRMTANVVVTSTLKRGQVFVPMHYETTNRLTKPVFDPYSKQPSYKACAVRIRRVGRRGRRAR